jgi:phosphoribosylformimino-5-aminoimidazole carboxamide ribotide isomerase
MHTEFTVYPAIDLRGGQVVRLQHGDPARQTVFGDDPMAVAERWIAAGASWLHVINLDGAFNPESGNTNWELLPRLAGLGVRVQFGGGIRTLDDVARALEAGAARAILGTSAVEKPELVAEAVARFGSNAVVVALDARNGLVRTRGWQHESEITALSLARNMRVHGVTRALHTDIGRDGVLAGLNAAASASLAQRSGLPVIASGGVASLDDVRLAASYAPLVCGVVVGRALYEGTFALEEALAVANRDEG